MVMELIYNKTHIFINANGLFMIFFIADYN
jgi:hypothetical protein